jgi:ABC-type lipoprotein export system ATPase subunit
MHGGVLPRDTKQQAGMGRKNVPSSVPMFCPLRAGHLGELLGTSGSGRTELLPVITRHLRVHHSTAQVDMPAAHMTRGSQAG